MHQGLTEDDTFLKLRKISFDNLKYQVFTMPDEVWNRMTNEELDDWMWDRGWTYHEYTVEYHIQKNITTSRLTSNTI